MKKLLGIVVLGLVWCNVGYANEKQIEYCADKLYNDMKFDNNERMNASMRAHRYLKKLYKDWKALAKMEKSIGEYRLQIIKDNDEMLEFLSKNLDEKINATSWYSGWVDICKEKQLEDPKLFKKYWDGPVEIRQLKGGSWD